MVHHQSQYTTEYICNSAANFFLFLLNIKNAYAVKIIFRRETTRVVNAEQILQGQKTIVAGSLMQGGVSAVDTTRCD